MKSVKQIANENNLDEHTVRNRIRRLGLKASIVQGVQMFNEIDERKIIEYVNINAESIRLYVNDKRRVDNEIAALNALYSLDSSLPHVIQQATGVPFHTAKRICQTKEVVAQSKINFNLV